MSRSVISTSPAPYPDVAVGVARGLPTRLGDQGVQGGHRCGEGEPDGVLHTTGVEPVQEVVGVPGAVGAEQHLLPRPGRVDTRQRGQRGPGDADVVGRSS